MQPATKRSKQIDAIIAFLMTRKDHPTADTIYMNIRKNFRISVWELCIEILLFCQKEGIS